MPSRDDPIRSLRRALRDGDLTLYLGAGVSVANGLPTWERLVLAMYFSAISDQPFGGWRPFANYLFAIAEWHLQRSQEPLEITARKIRMYHRSSRAFLEHLREMLYAGFASPDGEGFEVPPGGMLRAANPTLDAVARLCEAGRGVRAVVTYNYDGLLERALERRRRFRTVWRAGRYPADRLPIYHVHGYVPVAGRGSTAEEIVFTEEQYHLAAQDAYSWANLVQIRCLSGSVGLMVGLSLSDRNMRRLLDAVVKAPVPTENYALLQRPRWREPADAELEEIHRRAKEYLDRFRHSGVRREDYLAGIKGPTWQSQVLAILGQVEQLDVEQQGFVLRELGIEPIWYEDHAEIPEIVDAILA